MVPRVLVQQRHGDSEGPQPALWEASLVIVPWKWTMVVKLFYKTEFKM